VDRLLHEPRLIGFALLAVVLSRAVVAYGLPPFRVLQSHGWRWRTVIGVAGIRGGLALALALSLPPAMPQRAQIIDAVFAVVLFTVVVQGLSVGPLVRRLGVTAEA
ncbi:MAG: cation:proton antiporter, partial [Candidatus Eremiobacteraeota bacterium]|nr:cation:proton antiporter [Candidatus Eremiobacteraeota bacterium]